MFITPHELYCRGLGCLHCSAVAVLSPAVTILRLVRPLINLRSTKRSLVQWASHWKFEVTKQPFEGRLAGANTLRGYRSAMQSQCRVKCAIQLRGIQTISEDMNGCTCLAELMSVHCAHKYGVAQAKNDSGPKSISYVHVCTAVVVNTLAFDWALLPKSFI